MEQVRVNEQLVNQSGDMKNASAIVSPGNHTEVAVSPQVGGGTCSRGAAAGLDPNNVVKPTYVYALGRVNLRFPSVGVEKEFVQATAREGKNLVGLTDYKALHRVLSDRDNRYLVRQLCWVLAIEGVDTYILQPRDIVDLEMLCEAIRPVPSREDIDVVIGIKGPLAPPDMCNGLIVPIVGFDLIYSFERPKFLGKLKEKLPESSEELIHPANELLDRIIQMTDNAGAIDEHRGINYLAMRYDAIYTKVAEMNQRNFSLTEVEVGTSRLSGTRKIVAPIFSFTHRETGFVEKYFVRVDVTEEWPFLVTPLSPYYDR